jgi:hypothetical protein
MSMLACPFCYERVDAKRLWFRCTGRGAPGKEPCKPQFDDARKRAIDSDEHVLPSFAPVGRSLRTPTSAVCPDCGSQTGVKVCPWCHTKLPPGFGEGHGPLIAMIGAKGTGKSVYLKVLSYQLRNDLRRQFEADVHLVGDAARQDVLDPGGDLFPSRNLYHGTAQATAGRREPIVFAWRRRHQRIGLTRDDVTYLSFYDTSGEDLNAETTTEDLRYLGAADGLILLLDPFSLPHARSLARLPEEAIRFHGAAIDVLARVTTSLRQAHALGGRKSVPIPIAVAFAKFDAFFGVLGDHHPLVQWPEAMPFYDEPAGRAVHEYVRGLLYDWRADAIDAHLTHQYKSFRYFAVSALGIEPDYTDDTVDNRGVRPFRVEEPLLWLLSRFGVVPTGGSS